jgi:hypothetical protein
MMLDPLQTRSLKLQQRCPAGSERIPPWLLAGVCTVYNLVCAGVARSQGRTVGSQGRAIRCARTHILLSLAVPRRRNEKMSGDRRF